MRRWIVRVGVLALCLAALLVAPGLTVAGQEARAREDVLQELLAEVRGLRAALEQMGSAGARVQLAMGRLQIQEQRLNTERRRLDGIRDAIANGEREGSELRDRTAMAEEAIQRIAEPSARDELSTQIRMLKAAQTQKAAEVQRLREQEAELTGTVAAEEGRWTEISQRLDELERALAPRR